MGAPAHKGRDVFHPTRDDYSWWGGRGAAVVLTKDKNTGSWYKEATLLPQVTDPGANFGVSVDM